MTNFTANSTAPPPLAAEHPHASYMSPLTAIICLVALITIPMLSYTFFVAIRCPVRNPFRRSSSAAAPAAEIRPKAEKLELVCGVKYRKSEAGGDQCCPVCLSVPAEGEEIRQLSACGHAFHAACVDTWLCSHASCPVCRAAVPVKRSSKQRGSADRVDDFRQGLPDADSLM